MGTNILFWNCQDIRQKRKEIELYLKENVIDVIALNETFLSNTVSKFQFMILPVTIVQLAIKEALPSL